MQGPFTYRVEQSEAVTAAKIASRGRMFRAPVSWMLIVFGIVAILLLVLDAADGYLNVASTGALLLGLPGVWLALDLITPIMAKRQFRQSAQLRDENSLSFDDEALTFSGPRGTLRVPFAEFMAVTAKKDVILLHQTDMFYNLVPRRALGDAAEDLLAKMEAAGVKRL
ncbi:YcxB family protein [Croceicoccus pelagius]|uniref:YcxB-like C-terminal domain-containing protein n=1 Tax=Croceicoccus pelagius TaxID=1703341 RepID=A0A916YHW5_9SPHN|nr:YcxB family protein [Croceicoccus pelagius]GGD43965.1 hypothetical protein GCM10010989_17650 [Croceicoccus pelagius]